MNENIKIVIKDNNMFGGYWAFLSDGGYTPMELPFPLGINHGGYCYRDKFRAIAECKKDAKSLFDVTDIEVIDVSKY